MKDSPNPAGDHRESDEAAAQAILVQQLSHEVRALRRLMLALLTLALVLLSALCLEAYFLISRSEMVFREMLGSRSLPRVTQLVIVLGRSPVTLFALALAPVGAMAWLWLERERPATPAFVMLCLCVLLILFLVLVRLSLNIPLVEFTFGLGG
jgi:hypothetical protein